MKIAITGHSRGIGKALYDHFTQLGHTCMGFSRSNGYDISKPQDITRILDASEDCDVFINNAYYRFSQSNILTHNFDRWKDLEKTIVVINSRTRFGQGLNREYNMSKKQLHKDTIRCFTDPDKQCRVISISPGYVETDLTKHVQGKVKMMTPQHCAELISWCVLQPFEVEIGELSMWLTHTG